MSIPRPSFILSVLVAPLLLSWGLGTSHFLLDWASVPGASLLRLPALMSWPGLLAVAVLSVLATIRGPEARVLWAAALLAGTLGGLATLLPALVFARPILWVALLPLAMGGFSDPDSPWSLRQRALPLLGLCTWLPAMRLRPWGSGLLPEGVEDIAVGLVVSGSPWTGLLLVGLPSLVVALLLVRRTSFRPIPTVLGALLALLLEWGFGSGEGLLLAGLLGAVLGALALPFKEGLQEPLFLILPLLLLCGLLGLRSGVLERWDCSTARADGVRFLTTDQDIESIAAIPGNLPFLVVLREGGQRLERLGPTGLVNETRELEHPGGFLVSSGREGARFARVLPEGPGARIEWWNPSTLERTHSVKLEAPCRPGDAAFEFRTGAERVFVSCLDTGRIQFAEPGAQEASVLADLGPGAPLSVASPPSVFRGGVLAALRLAYPGPDAPPGLGPVSVGPWSSAAALSPVGLLIARGPVGQLELRGGDPLSKLLAPESQPSPREDTRRGLRNVLERVRVGRWPDKLAWSGSQSAVYVTSSAEGRVYLVDPQVGWHQASVRVGAPPRQIVADSDSGRLFGVNRCGLFEVWIPSVFPWESTGDVEEAGQPVGKGAPGS
ncbi:MAG: hypothetical protein VX498_09375 [Myxococcota bacterium]|nr:hypothetical protein [Myxococcota bacterium]